MTDVPLKMKRLISERLQRGHTPAAKLKRKLRLLTKINDLNTDKENSIFDLKYTLRFDPNIGHHQIIVASKCIYVEKYLVVILIDTLIVLVFIIFLIILSTFPT